MYVFLGFDKIEYSFPSQWTMPTPILFALPSMPSAVSGLSGTGRFAMIETA